MPHGDARPLRSPEQMTAILVEVMGELREAAIFYRDASQQVSSIFLRQMFARLADDRETALTLLRPLVPEGIGGEILDESTDHASRRRWADMQASIGNTEAVLLDALTGEERRLRQTVATVTDAVEGHARTVLERVDGLLRPAESELAAAASRPQG
jgi:hypothetical protein